MKKHKYETSFPLDLERKAFREVKEELNEVLEKRKKLYDVFISENKEILNFLREKNVELINPSCKVSPHEAGPLIDDIFTKIIRRDPILFRVVIHNSIPPQNNKERKYVKGFLPDELLNPYFGSLKESLMKGIGRDKRSAPAGIPVCRLLVGKVLGNLLWDFEHYKYVDAAKEAGAEGSTEELREKRIYKNREGVVFDYSPLIKYTMAKERIIVDLFSKNEFRRAKRNEKKFLQLVDGILCSFIQEVYPDPKHEILFGRDRGQCFTYVVRYGKEQSQTPIQLFPKHLKSINAKGKRYFLTNLEMKDTARSKDDEKQIAQLGLFTGALTWKREKGPATNWLSEMIGWALGNEFEKQSIQQKGKRTLKENIDSSAGRLYDFVDDDRSKILLDFIDLKTSSPEENMIEYENNTAKEKSLTKISERKREKLFRLLGKEQKGKKLNNAEKVYKHRIRKELQEKFKNLMIS